jgi:hypothetical protein
MSIGPVISFTDGGRRLPHHVPLDKRRPDIMTISELIARLEAVKAEHGDVTCVIRDGDLARRLVKGIKHRESRPSPWRARQEPVVEIHG